MLKALRTEALRQFQEEGYYSPVDVILAEEVREYRAGYEAFWAMVRPVRRRPTAGLRAAAR